MERSIWHIKKRFQFVGLTNRSTIKTFFNSLGSNGVIKVTFVVKSPPEPFGQIVPWFFPVNYSPTKINEPQFSIEK